MQVKIVTTLVLQSADNHLQYDSLDKCNLFTTTSFLLWRNLLFYVSGFAAVILLLVTFLQNVQESCFISGHNASLAV